jgi:hypothetical protein
MVMPEITGKVEYGRVDDLQWDMIFRPVISIEAWPRYEEAYLERPRTIPIGKLILHKAVIIDIYH